MKKFQIKTHGNENLARAIQEKLFELGHRWWMDNEVKYLFAASYQVGETGNNTISWSRDEDNYEFGPFVTIDELFAMKPEPKETVKIGDQTYDKKQFEEATKNLTPIN